MPDVNVSIGGRDFAVACQEGEEVYLQSAGQILDNEAQVLADQLGRMTEARMLLMAGLMLADKTAGLEEELRRYEAAYGEQEKELEALRNAPTPEPEQIEVPMIPPSLVEGLGELAAQAEAVAEQVEARVAAAG